MCPRLPLTAFTPTPKTDCTRLPPGQAICSTIECCIDEWSTGTRTDIPFTIQEYRATYDSHLKCLQAFAEATKTYDVLPSICRRLYEVGRIHSGAAPLTAPTEVTVSAQIIATAIKEHEEGSTTEDESD
ncbi:hypothetical protein EDD15DRAFT_2531311 [Pisolithus albus]|nr:hypothetical protein EDD15DRAFT_2531311 [Pisolithus albus]